MRLIQFRGNDAEGAEGEVILGADYHATITERMTDMALEIQRPKWILDTKRGWGMFITGALTMAPLVSVYAEQWFGVKLDAAMLSTLGEAGVQFIDAAAWMVGIGLWVWGSFRPTGDLVMNKSNAGTGGPATNVHTVASGPTG